MELPKWIMRRLWRSVIEFDMLAPDDRILVGLSGGKDSSFLLYCLAALMQQAPFPLELAALHVDQGFSGDFDISPMDRFCRNLNVPFSVRRTRIYQAAFNHDRQNPCAQCAYLRRAFVNDYARRHSFNKVALAHHLDDAVETMMMSQLYAGQSKTFHPVTYLDRCGITVIRPLVYFREEEIKGAGSHLDYTPVDTPCPMAGKSARAGVKKLIGELSRENKFVFDNLVSVMREGKVPDLWPPLPGRSELRAKIKQFWCK